MATNVGSRKVKQMKKNISMHPKNSIVTHSQLDETEKQLLAVSKAFKKMVCSTTVAVRNTVKARLRMEMSHVIVNRERLIHGKA